VDGMIKAFIFLFYFILFYFIWFWYWFGSIFDGVDWIVFL